MSALGNISPVVEAVAIDEAYLDYLSGLQRLIGPTAVIGRQAKAAIQDAVGLTASVGIADDRVYPATERQSISKETTFGEDVIDAAVLRNALRWAAHRRSAIWCSMGGTQAHRSPSRFA